MAIGWNQTIAKRKIVSISSFIMPHLLKKIGVVYNNLSLHHINLHQVQERNFFACFFLRKRT